MEVSRLLTSTGVDLLLSGVLRSGAGDAMEWAETAQLWYSSHNQLQLAWNIGGRTEGHLASLVGPAMVKFYQMLLLTLPGTPVFNYGDEIGLVDEVRRAVTKRQHQSVIKYNVFPHLIIVCLSIVKYMYCRYYCKYYLYK